MSSTTITRRIINDKTKAESIQHTQEQTVC